MTDAIGTSNLFVNTSRVACPALLSRNSRDRFLTMSDSSLELAH